MPPRRITREMPYDPASVVRDLRAFRKAMNDLSRTVIPFGTVYKAAHVITAGIDGLAAVLTGDPEYFWDGGTSFDNGLHDKLARESGEKPWQ